MGRTSYQVATIREYCGSTCPQKKFFGAVGKSWKCFYCKFAYIRSPTWHSKGGHADYVRAMDSSPQCSQVFASGSYDHMVKLWDSRQPNPALNMGWSSLSGGDDGENDPIECVLFAKSAALLLAAQGPRVRVWDLLGGGRSVSTHI